MFERLDNLDTIDKVRIEKILAAGKTAIIQFSKPIYDKRLLAEVDTLCRENGDNIEVRFYGHYSTDFDASILAHIPNVQCLSIDCLTRISAIEHLFNLTCLRRLSLGIFELDMPEVLSRIRITKLRELRLCESRKSNIDLSPLARCIELSRLHVTSHCVGFQVLKDLGALTDLSLSSIAKKQTLDVVCSIPQLTTFRLLLGGRPNIDDVCHPKLKQLEIIRILGFSSVGNLSRFPALQELRIEDQIRLESIDLGKASPELVKLAVCNCKKLGQLGSFARLARLQELVIGQTSVDFDALMKSPLPSSLRTIRFLTGKLKADAAIRAQLDALGYGKFSDRAKV